MIKRCYSSAIGITMQLQNSDEFLQTTESSEFVKNGKVPKRLNSQVAKLRILPFQTHETDKFFGELCLFGLDD